MKLCALLLASGILLAQGGGTGVCASEKPISNLTRAQIEARVRDMYRVPSDVSVRLVAERVSDGCYLSVGVELGSSGTVIPFIVSPDKEFLFTDMRRLAGLSDTPPRPIVGKGQRSRTATVFSDLSCPISRKWLETVLSQQSGKGDLPFINLVPIVPAGNEEAMLGSKIAYCAYSTSQDRGRELTLRILDVFDRHTDHGTLQTSLREIERESGLSGCTDSWQTLGAIFKGQDLAAIEAVRISPTSILQGKKVEGAIPREEFVALANGVH